MKPELFRAGSSDENVFKSVVENNEYKLGGHFEPDDLILDLGSHIGSFAYACLQRGAKHIMCFEPDPENYWLLRQHLADYIKDGSVETFPVAVIGGVGVRLRKFSGVVKYKGEMNHGGAFLLSPDGSSYGLGQYIVNQPFRVVCIPVDYITSTKVRLLKLDVENSEYDIIGTSSLYLIQEIVGEYHPFGRNTKETLKDDLEQAGYTVELKPHDNSELGLFFAVRK